MHLCTVYGPTNFTCTLFMNPQISLFSNFFIKNGFYSTIHTFKNYFDTVFSVFSFSKISFIQMNYRFIWLELRTSFPLFFCVCVCFSKKKKKKFLTFFFYVKFLKKKIFSHFFKIQVYFSTLPIKSNQQKLNKLISIVFNF